MLVSVLIPTHNRIGLLRQTLSSFRDVRVPSAVNLELIVVANACADGTYSAVERISGDYPFELTVAKEPTPGQNWARNKALKLATGDVFAFVDDDIRLDRTWLRGLVEVFKQYEADVVGGRTKLWWEDVEKPEWFKPYLSPILAAYDHGDTVQEVGLPGPIGANMAIRRRVYQEIGGFRTGIQNEDNSLYRGNEVEYLQRADNHGFRGYYAPDALVYHWVSPDRIEPHFFEESGWGYGHSRVSMKNSFEPFTAAHSMAGYLYLAGRHGLQQALAQMSGDTAAQYYHSYTKNIGLGGLHGSFLRLKDKRFG